MPTTNETSIGDNRSQDDFVFAPVYAEIPSMICVSILISNIIILVTFSRMRNRRLQDLITACLSVVDLLTTIPLTISIVGLLVGSAVTLNHTVCNLWAVALHSCIGTTGWMHSVLCIEKCYSIVRPIAHRTFA